MPGLGEVLDSVRSVAIIGASPKRGKVGYELINNILKFGFRGRIYPVNPKYNEVLGIKAWKHLSELPEVPDIVVVAIPATYVPRVLEEAGKLGVRLAIIVSSGFRESGRRDLEESVKEVSSRYGIRLVGPNSAGLSISKLDLHASIEVLPSKGGVAILTQSGALGGVIISRLKELNSGVSLFVSLGNMADVSFNDFLEYLAESEETEVILEYIEWVKEGRKFIELSRRVSKTKPQVILSGWWGEATGKAVTSHTGGLAVAPKILEAVAKKVGAFLVRDVDEMVEVGEALRKYGGVPCEKALVLTNSGGLGILVSSVIESSGIKLPQLTTNLKDLMKKVSGKDFTGDNPVDFGGDASIDQLVRVAEMRELRKRYDVLILVYVPTSAESPETICRHVSDLGWRASLPTVVYFKGEGAGDVVKCASRSAAVASTSLNVASIIKALMFRYTYLKGVKSSL